MSAHWHIGIEVECIRNDLDEGADPRLVVGATYTVRDTILETGVMWNGAHRNSLAIRLNEIHGWLPLADGSSFTDAYWPEYFRPVQKRTTSIEIFTALLHPTEDEIFREFEAAEFDYDENIVVPR